MRRLLLALAVLLSVVPAEAQAPRRSLTGNASTATALARDPDDCDLGEVARSIDERGNLSCQPLTLSGWAFSGQGTATTVLHGNATGNPTWAAVSLSSDVTGNLPIAHLASGAGASGTTFLRGDNTWATPSGTTHTLLSATHTDTTAASVVRGDVITGQAGPVWARLAIGASGLYLKSNGTDLVYSTLAAAGTGACGANTWASTLNGDAAPTCTQPAASNLSNGTTGTGAVVLAGTPSLTGNLEMPTTTSSTTGVITKGGTRFIHNFALAGTTGENTFVGVGAGNFTMTGSTGGQGSNNTGFGFGALAALTIGNTDNAFGSGALGILTTGVGNASFGHVSLGSLVTGSFNSGFGHAALLSATGDGNTGIGYSAGRTITSGSYTVSLGFKAGYHASQLATATNSTSIGANTYTSSSNQVVIGDSGVTDTQLRGTVTAPMLVISTTQSPASGGACTAGEFTWNATYVYVCTSSGNWKRAALTGGY